MPSAAVISGFWRTCGAGVPSAAKKTRPGPSEVKRSGSWLTVKTSGNGPRGFGGSPGSSSVPYGRLAGAAATLNASTAAEWPRLTPGVAHAGRPSAEALKRPPKAVTSK